MSSLDGYSLNEKIERLYDEVRAEIAQLQQDFHHFYSMMKDMEQKIEDNNNVRKQTKKSNAKKANEKTSVK
tara:strand:- start:819 stop:1031 length:213 start_codon:yes stop_codon:yes gene_type:complete